MSVPSLMFNLQKASTYLIFIIAFVNCITPPTFPQSSYFNFNITSEPERFDEDNCPPLEPIENGNFLIKEYMGQRAAFISCNKNFTLVGKSIIMIVCDNGIWKSGFDEIFPKCEKRCPPPPYLEHGDVDLEKKLEDVYSPTGSYLEGTVATYTCNEGYILEPSLSSFRICEKGIWTGIDAFCKPTRDINCARPPVIENGYMQPSFPLEYSPIPVGQEVLYECLHGFKLVGSEKIRCSDHGLWLPEAPSCHKETEIVNDKYLEFMDDF